MLILGFKLGKSFAWCRERFWVFKTYIYPCCISLPGLQDLCWPFLFFLKFLMPRRPWIWLIVIYKLYSRGPQMPKNLNFGALGQPCKIFYKSENESTCFWMCKKHLKSFSGFYLKRQSCPKT